MRFHGAWGERLRSAWTEMRDNLGRSVLQALGVMLGVAGVLGGFSIMDSQRRRADELYAKLGGMDKLNVQPAATVKDGTAPSALQMANLGLRTEDAADGETIGRAAVDGVSVQRFATGRVRSAFADQQRQISGIARDFFPLNGYAVDLGRDFSAREMEEGAPVAILGFEAASVFFPTGNAIGQTIRVGDVPVSVIGVLSQKVFRFVEKQGNLFAWRNKIIAVPATLVARRMQGDAWQRVDRMTFRVPKIDVMQKFSDELSAVLRANHRQQDDVRIDDVAARIRRRRSQGSIYEIVFLLSGVLSLFGGGLVNVNIQMASLKERVREVGVRMAIGASGREVFKEFMTEALLLTLFGSGGGLILGIAFSKGITSFLMIPLYMEPASFGWAIALAVAFGLVFALFPAWKASRLSPMEALRYE